MAFEDTWEWNIDAEAAFEEIVERGGRVSDAMRALRTFLGHSGGPEEPRMPIPKFRPRIPDADQEALRPLNVF
jgi:hypothetical protein